MYEISPTFQHYVLVNQDTGVVYGRKQDSLYDTVIMRLKFGYKYYWELGYQVEAKDRRCRVCNLEDSHTLPHYILHCVPLTKYRNTNILDVTSQIIWMINNGKIGEILLTNRNFAPRI